MRLLLLFAVACRAATPVAAPVVANDAAVTALRAGRFADALHADGRDARTAAARALAGYVVAGDELYASLRGVLEHADRATAFDHEAGRTAWRRFADQLAAVDRDLAIVAADPQFSLELCLACWQRDWNHDGAIDQRDAKLFALEGFPDGDPRRTPTFRFDVGDAEWARAMVAFQRAAVELILAYRWSDLDALLYDHATSLHIRLYDKGRVAAARTQILAGLDHAEKCRARYLAETDDDREWVPNPRQQSHPIPLPVDDALYTTWKDILGDVRRLIASEEGISLRELGSLIEPQLGAVMPEAYIDLGAMLREPADFTIELKRLDPSTLDAAARALLGHGYRAHMASSPLVGRLARMRRELEQGGDTLGHKLRYLLWLN